MSERDLVKQWLETKEKTERLRSQIEEKNIKGLDNLLAHTGNDPMMKALSGLRKWWMNYKRVGMADPPNIDMVLQGQFQVETIEWDMAAHVASADVYHDDTIDRRRKVYFEGARGLRGLTHGEGEQ